MGSLSVWVDESEKGNILVVAGVLAAWDAVLSIVKDWRSKVKAALGLPPEAEIKWTPHKTLKRALEQGGKTTKDLHEKAIDFVASRDDLTCVAVVMVERRKKSSQQKANVRDFYCEGLKYLIQRAAEEVVEAKLRSCVVVRDRPELGKKYLEQGTIRRGSGAVEKAYRGWYLDGVGVGPGKKYHRGPLADIGFHPSVLIGDATYHDMLQIADVVAGVTRGWVDAVRANRASPWEVKCFKDVSVRFRRRHGAPDFFGDGFVLWPWENELWTSLQRSVR
jgi:hypothetical protein